MTNLVEQINDGIESRISTVLGATFTKLDYVFDVERNQSKKNNKRYASRPLSATTVATINRAFTLDHDFEIILTQDYKEKNKTDLEQQQATMDLFSRMDDIYKDLYNTKIGLPSIVLNIPVISIAEPEYIEEHHIVVLRGIVVVKYRNNL